MESTMKSTRGFKLVLARLAALWLLAILVFPAAAAVKTGQEPATMVSGAVMDTLGAAVGGARITLISDTRGLLRETATDEDGTFRFPLVLSGTYTLLADLKGFTKVRVVNLIVDPSGGAR